jgi:WD40 repeat protein
VVPQTVKLECGIVSDIIVCVCVCDCFTNSFYLVRTGQAHRTLPGHNAPITCLQFDEVHLVSGSLDKTIRVCSVLFKVRDCILKVLLDMGSSYRISI